MFQWLSSSRFATLSTSAYQDQSQNELKVGAVIETDSDEIPVPDEYSMAFDSLGQDQDDRFHQSACTTMNIASEGHVPSAT